LSATDATVSLRARYKDAFVAKPLLLSGEQLTKPVTLRISAKNAQSVRVRVVDEVGKPVAGAKITLWNGNYPIICAPCETLAPRALKWLLDQGADPRVAARDYGSPLKMLICTYVRNAKGRNACLEVFADAGFDLPDTPAMAFHCGRIDLLEAHLDRDPFAAGTPVPRE
jgi:hypothetical protein